MIIQDDQYINDIKEDLIEKKINMEVKNISYNLYYYNNEFIAEILFQFC